MTQVLDPHLLDFLDSLDGSPFKQQVWRIAWKTRDPIAGNSAGGRWSPDGNFEVLYTSLESDGALAEVYHHLSSAPVMSSSHVMLHEIELDLGNVLLLDSVALANLGVEYPQEGRVDYKQTQAIGQACHMLNFEAIVVPSARWQCNNLVLFMDQIDIDNQVSLIASDDINWPAWRESSLKDENQL